MTVDGRKSVALCAAAVQGACVLTVEGLLDSATYLPLRNAIITAALDQPRAVILDVTGLDVAAGSAWAVFTSAHWQVSRSWPCVAVMLVCADTGRRNAIPHCVVGSMPVYPSAESAIAALAGLPRRRPRRRAHAELAAEPASIGQSRQLVTQ